MSVYLNCISDGIDVKVPLAEIDKGVEHSEAIVILANIEAFVMELVHSSIVTVKPKEWADKDLWWTKQFVLFDVQKDNSTFQFDFYNWNEMFFVKIGFTIRDVQVYENILTESVQHCL